MNRPLIVALVLAFTPLAALAQVEENPDDKQARVDKYQDRRLIVLPDPEDKREKERKPGDAKVSPRLLLRQGPDLIYQSDFVKLIDDPSLNGFWNREKAKDWGIWLGTGAVGIPLGTLIFMQNFRGDGALAPFAQPGRPQAADAGDLRAYTLSVVGAGIAFYGAYNLGLWIAENLDLHHPDRLEADAIEPRAREWNEQLRERLALDPSDIPSPPPPRPSPSPSKTPSDFDDDAGTLTASPPNGGPGNLPYGEGAEVPTPKPLQFASPGAVPSALVPTPAPRPSIFKFYPGNQGYPVPSLRPDPDATPTAVPPATPVPSEPSPSPGSAR